MKSWNFDNRWSLILLEGEIVDFEIKDGWIRNYATGQDQWPGHKKLVTRLDVRDKNGRIQGITHSFVMPESGSGLIQIGKWGRFLLTKEHMSIVATLSDNHLNCLVRAEVDGLSVDFSERVQLDLNHWYQAQYLNQRWVIPLSTFMMWMFIYYVVIGGTLFTAYLPVRFDESCWLCLLFGFLLYQNHALQSVLSGMTLRLPTMIDMAWKYNPATQASAQPDTPIAAAE